MASNRILNSAEFFFSWTWKFAIKKKLARILSGWWWWWWGDFFFNSTIIPLYDVSVYRGGKIFFHFLHRHLFCFVFQINPKKMFWNPDKYLYIDRSISTMNKTKKTRQNIIIIRIGNHLFFSWAFIIIITWFIRLGNFFFVSLCIPHRMASFFFFVQKKNCSCENPPMGIK